MNGGDGIQVGDVGMGRALCCKVMILLMVYRF